MLPEPDPNRPQITRPLYLNPEVRVPLTDRLRDGQQPALQTNEHASPHDAVGRYGRDIPLQLPWHGDAMRWGWERMSSGTQWSQQSERSAGQSLAECGPSDD